jgi:hypothetical protein
MNKYTDWIRLPNTLWEAPDVEALSDAAFRAHIAAHSLSDRLSTDGVLTKTKVATFAKPASRRELIEAGRWRELPDGSIEVLDFADLQRSAAEKEAAKAKGRKAGIASVAARNGGVNGTVMSDEEIPY